MLTSKQRAYLRSLANKQPALFQIGKGGISETMLKELEAVLEKRELVKITVIETAFITPRSACDEICEAIGSEGVMCIGNKLVIYKESKDNKQIELPKK